MRARSGTIDQTKSGRYRVKLTVATNRRVSLSTFDTIEEAEQARAAALDVMKKEGLSSGTTLLQLGEEVLTEREISRRIRDPRNDWSRWRHYVVPHPIAKMAVQKISRKDVMAWFESVRRRVAHSTALNALNVLRVIFREAVNLELIKATPISGFRVTKEVRTEEAWTFLDLEEQKRLLAAAEGHERVVLAFAMGTGLRAGELCALKKVDVILNGSPHVIVRYGKPRNKPTKSGKIRRVPLFGMALEAAKQWSRELDGWANANPHGLMFPRKGGTYRDEMHVLRYETWNKLKAKAGIKRRLRWHDLRHTCASSLVSGFWGRSWSIEEVKEMLGHSSIVVTQRYAHLGETALKKAADETGHAFVHKDTQVAAAVELSGLFVNRRSGVQIPKAAPNEISYLADPDQEVRGRLVDDSKLRALAGAVLFAVEKEAHDVAWTNATALAEEVLAIPEVRLALEVLDGDRRHALSRAIDLATKVLEVRGSDVNVRGETRKRR